MVRSEKRTIRMSYVLTGQLAYLGERLELMHGEVREENNQDVLRSDRSVSLPWGAS
jgi:hypothetical protein